MVNISAIFELFNYIFGNNYVLIAIFSTLFSVKLIIALYLLSQLFKRAINIHLILLIWVVIAACTCDIPWILIPLKPYLDYRLLNFFIRLSWISTILLYQSLTLFIDQLNYATQKLPRYQKLFITCSLLLIICFISIMIIDFNCPGLSEKQLFERLLTKISSIYTCLILMPTNLFFTFRNLRNNTSPRILKKQLSLFLQAIVIPVWLSDTIQILSMIIAPLGEWINTNYTFVNLANLLITYGIFYSTRKMVGLRFLNIKSQVSLPVTANFVHNTKDILVQLSQVNSESELCHLTHTFFKDSFQIPLSKVLLYIRPIENNLIQNNFMETINTPQQHTLSLVEEFIHTKPNIFNLESKILVYDELVFSNFYEQNNERTQAIHFLNEINADIFIPLYIKNNIIASIMIGKKARTNHDLYNEIETDHMLIFASYLGNLINLLQHRNLNILIEQEKKLTDELYNKEQEINQYKESIHSFLYENETKMIGIIFYKNRLFTFGNQAAKQMIKISPNNHRGHPFTKSLTTVALHVQEYRTPHTIFTKDEDNRPLVISGVPQLDNNSVIIILSYPEISDIIKKQLSVLKNPNERDYLLYLSSTQAGLLVNDYIPGNGPILLQIKIALLKKALSQKIVLLEAPIEDRKPLINLIHTINVRTSLHTITLHERQKDNEITIQLFGINPLFGLMHSTEPLLAKLAHKGTIVIEHIDFLDIETQRHLVEFIKYGHYRMFKCNRKEISNARILCTTSQPLGPLVQQGIFLNELYIILQTNTLTLPAPHSLPPQELDQLIEAYAEQITKTELLKNCFVLTEHEKNGLREKKPDSLLRLKTDIEQLLVKKAYKYRIQTTTITHTNTIDIQESEKNSATLDHAVKLGKHALKDAALMKFLWHTYKNQHKIATLLGVNRSSVNRRCKMYNLL